jgi:hypothetical protein
VDIYNEMNCPSRPPNLPVLSQFENQVRWLGPPAEYQEGTGSTLPRFLASPLQCTPHFRDWSPAALSAEFGGDADTSGIYAYGAEVVPCSLYLLQQIDVRCSNLSNESCYSVPGTAQTGEWGDIVSPFGGISQPNFGDISAVVEKFRALSGAVTKPRAQLQPNVVNPAGDISFADISVCVESFRGFAYLQAGPDPCP